MAPGMRASQHAFQLAGEHAPRHHTHRDHTRNHTHGDTHTGDNTLTRLLKSSRGLHTPQAPRAPVCSTHPLTLARHDRIPLAETRLKGAYSLPLFPREDNQLLTPGLTTLGELTPIVPHCLYVCVCVCVRL